MIALAPLRPDPGRHAAYSASACALMAGLCEAAYCPAADIAREISTAGFTLLGTFGRAFLAISPTAAVLAFRGTEDLQDWQVNLNARLEPIPGKPGVLVHRGFFAAYAEQMQALHDAVETHVGVEVPLYVAGHSLGGALAQIATAWLDRPNLAACYTFGSPRVATASFDALVRAPHYRVVNDWDLVPGVPTPWFSRYRHGGDPRLLVPGETCALRRDRGLAARFLIDLAALAAGVATRRYPCVADHMIWAYRARLEAIAASSPA